MPRPINHLQGIIVPSGRRVHELVLMLPGRSLVIGLGNPEYLEFTFLTHNTPKRFSLPICARPVCSLLPLFCLFFVVPTGLSHSKVRRLQ